jgi:UDP-N-acetylmuramyl tripeptide synthase
VIGVTGTNGKTTTAFLIHKMLHEAGYKVGLMTTVAYGAGDDIKPQTVHMTNVPVPMMMKRLKYLKKQGAEWLVMETTSMALAQNRAWGVPFYVAVMTNISQDHLIITRRWKITSPPKLSFSVLQITTEMAQEQG